MYVVKIPQRSDFCGCPPCPLCYDWVEPAPPVEVEIREIRGGELVVDKELQVPTGYRIDGMRKMVEDILGENVTPTPEQKQQLLEGAMAVHVRNLERNKLTEKEAVQETVDESWVAKGVEALLTQRRKAAENKSKPLNTVNIDSIADKVQEKDKVPEEVEERIKNNVTVPTSSSSAPVDDDLLRRERKYAGRVTKETRDQMMARYMKNLEEERRKWEQQMMKDKYSF